MNDHPVLRAIPICPLCLEDKAQGLLVCWPCHRTQTAHNGGAYGAHAERRIDAVSSYVALLHTEAQRVKLQRLERH